MKMMWSKRILACGILALLTCAGSAAGQAKPNVIVFLVDDLGWSDVACYGSSFYDTPNIDKLAEQGMRFTNAYATCHVCSPSRASIMTGKYPARLKLTDWLTGRREFPFQRLANAEIHQALPLEETTLAEALKDYGYRTGQFGKWHLGEDDMGPLSQGFDVQIPNDWYKGWPKAGYHALFEMGGLKEQTGDYLTDNLTDKALEFIQQGKDGHFFLYLSLFSVHDPIQGRADLVRKYEKRRELLTPDVMPYVLEGNPDAEEIFTPDQLEEMIQKNAYRGHKVLPNNLVKIKQRQDNPQFAAMVECMDENLGRVMDQLDVLGLSDDTIIIFTSDNGGMAAANFGRPYRNIHPAKTDAAYSTSNLPLRGAKGWMYEGGIRVPLIIKWPGKALAGSTSDEPVTGTDYYPTILEMIAVPPMPEQHMDGVSLVPVLESGGSLGRDAIYWHFPHYSNHGMQSPGAGIRSGKYKLLEYFENGTVQLFDLESDLEETTNLAKQRPEIVSRLLEKLHQWQDEVGAEMMGPNPGYDENAKPSDTAPAK
jgi:arylsulfatase A-like enzyme